MRKIMSRRDKFPRNHFTNRDPDCERYVVSLNGVPQPYCFEANIRGAWIIRYKTDAEGKLVIHGPFRVETERLYGKVTVELMPEA